MICLNFSGVLSSIINLIWFFIAASTATYACGQKTEGSISDSLGSLGSIFEDGCKKHENKVCKHFFFKILINLLNIKIFQIFFREPTNYWQVSPDKKLQVKFVSVLETSATLLDLINSIWFWHFLAQCWHFVDLLIRNGKYVVLDICNYNAFAYMPWRHILKFDVLLQRFCFGCTVCNFIFLCTVKSRVLACLV